MILDADHPGPNLHTSRKFLINDLKAKCMELSHASNMNVFPGSQPVSLLKTHLHKLRTEDYYVCEKTDDRKYNFIPVKGFNPLFEKNPNLLTLLNNSLLDGELVVDEFSSSNGEVEKESYFMIFDCINIRGSYVGNSSLRDRLKIAQGEFIFLMNNAMQEYTKKNKVDYPFFISLKHMYKKEDVGFALDKVLDNLEHENDGLIFTENNLPFIIGTCEGILKWKPIELNTVDFQLQTEWLFSSPSIDSASSVSHPNQNLFFFNDQILKSSSTTEFISYKELMQINLVEEEKVKKFRYCKLMCGVKGTPTEYDYIYLDEKTHEKFLTKYKGNPIVVECCLRQGAPRISLKKDPDANTSDIDVGEKVTSWEDVKIKGSGGWEILRVREDKNLGNDIRTVRNVMKSIEANIQPEDLKKLCGVPVNKYAF
eukprot:snap_masked-scaffold_36-processed-gene-0.27-mRNA-1 protein AED:0.45 eAED:0.45 QI:0/0/0/0.5/1/1/2/0/424